MATIALVVNYRRFLEREVGKGAHGGALNRIGNERCSGKPSSSMFDFNSVPLQSWVLQKVGTDGKELG